MSFFILLNVRLLKVPEQPKQRVEEKQIKKKETKEEPKEEPKKTYIKFNILILKSIVVKNLNLLKMK